MKSLSLSFNACCAVALHCCWGTNSSLLLPNAPHTVSPQLVSLHGLLSLQDRILHLSWWNSTWFPPAHSSSLSRSHWKTALPLRIWTGPSSLVFPANLMRVHVTSSRSLMQILNRTGASINPVLLCLLLASGHRSTHPYFFSNTTTFFQLVFTNVI